MRLEEILRIPKARDFLDALVNYNEEKSQGPTSARQQRIAEMVILLRAFYWSVLNEDFGGFINDSTCGGRIAELKEVLAMIGAREASDFVKLVEERFPDQRIPTDSNLRFEQFAELEESMGGLWIIDLSQQNIGSAERAVSLLAEYVARNPGVFERG